MLTIERVRAIRRDRGRQSGPAEIEALCALAEEALLARDTGEALIARVQAEFADELSREEPVPLNAGISVEISAALDEMHGDQEATPWLPPGDGWIEWAGGENPVPGKMVACLMRVERKNKVWDFDVVPSGLLRWTQSADEAGDILAYLIIKEPS
jgi:hypothetical protein